jgi:hypothetical protein
METLMEPRAGHRNQTTLPLIFVHIDANMFVVGFLGAALTALILGGALYCHIRVTPIGKPPPLAVRFAEALPIRRAQGSEQRRTLNV